MATKDLQILKLKFNQGMINSLFFTWERNFELTLGIFSILVTQINVLESLRYLSVLKLVMIKNVKTVIFRPLNQSFANISSLPKNYSNDLCHFLLNFSASIFQIQSRKSHQQKVSLALI